MRKKGNKYTNAVPPNKKARNATAPAVEQLAKSRAGAYEPKAEPCGLEDETGVLAPTHKGTIGCAELMSARAKGRNDASRKPGMWPPTEERRQALREVTRRFVASLQGTPGLANFAEGEGDGRLRLSFGFAEPKRAYDFAAAMSATLARRSNRLRSRSLPRKATEKICLCSVFKIAEEIVKDKENNR